jgi:hypothetical protein
MRTGHACFVLHSGKILQNSNAESGIASDPRHLSQNPKRPKAFKHVY